MTCAGLRVVLPLVAQWNLVLTGVQGGIRLRVILFGATGMVGQGVLRECVLDPEVEAVLSVVRRATGPSLGREEREGARTGCG